MMPWRNTEIWGEGRLVDEGSGFNGSHSAHSKPPPCRSKLAESRPKRDPPTRVADEIVERQAGAVEVPGKGVHARQAGEVQLAEIDPAGFAARLGLEVC
jgi:hypothetical protein